MVVLFLVELLITFNKTSFFNLLVYCSIFSIIFLGYFDRYYMKFVLFCIVLSIVFDLLWVIFLANVLIYLFSLSGILLHKPSGRLFKLDFWDSNSQWSSFSWSARYFHQICRVFSSWCSFDIEIMVTMYEKLWWWWGMPFKSMGKERKTIQFIFFFQGKESSAVKFNDYFIKIVKLSTK